MCYSIPHKRLEREKRYRGKFGLDRVLYAVLLYLSEVIYMSRGRPMIGVRLDQETIDELRRLAAEKELTVADVVRELIASWIADNTQK